MSLLIGIFYLMEIQINIKSRQKYFLMKCQKNMLTTTMSYLKSAINNWEVSLPFNKDITLSDSWNCNCSLDGTTLCITALDYNSVLQKGNSANDIGFIINCP